MWATTAPGMEPSEFSGMVRSGSIWAALASGTVAFWTVMDGASLTLVTATVTGVGADVLLSASVAVTMRVTLPSSSASDSKSRDSPALSLSDAVEPTVWTSNLGLSTANVTPSSGEVTSARGRSVASFSSTPAGAETAGASTMPVMVTVTSAAAVALSAPLLSVAVTSPESVAVSPWPRARTAGSPSLSA